MADITIKLDSATKEFAASLREANQNITALVAELKTLVEQHKKEAAESAKAAAAEKEASALRIEAAKQLTAEKRKAAEDAKRIAREEANAKKQADKEAAEHGKSLLDEAARMKQLFLNDQKDRLKQAAEEEKKIEQEKIALGLSYLDETARMKQLFINNQKELKKKEAEDENRIEKEKLDLGNSYLDQAAQMKKAFLANQKTQEKIALDQTKKLKREEADLGKSNLAEAARMKQLFLNDIKAKEKRASEEAKKLKEEERQAQRRTSQEAIALQKKQIEETKKLANATALLTNVYNILFSAVQKAFSFGSGVIKDAIKNVDDFKRNTIGTAAAITNLADPTLKFGKTWGQVFIQNLRETESIYIELETLAAKYFSTANDLQLAYNAFAQRGIVIRKDELSQLAQLTDLILLVTQGQQSSIQVQEEIRSLVTGTLRPTAQLAQIVRSFGLDVKQVSEDIRRTQSLKPLEGILQGAKAASGEIQKTFTAALNGLTTVFRQIERIGASVLYEKIVEQTRKLTTFLQNNRGTIVKIFGLIGAAVEKATSYLEQFLEDIFTADGKIGPALDVLIELTATVLTLSEAFFDLTKHIALFVVKLPATILRMRDAFKKAAEEAKKAREEVDKVGTENRPSALTFGLDKVIPPTGPGQQVKPKTPEEGGLFDFLFGKGSFEGSKAAAKELAEEFEKEFGAIGKGDFLKDRANMAVFIRDRIAEVLEKLKEVGKETEKGFVGTRIPFKLTEEEENRLKVLRQQNIELALQVAKGKRALDNTALMAKYETDIAALRRELALIEEGFVVFAGSGGSVVQGFRSIDQAINQFRIDYAEALLFNADDFPFFRLAQRIGEFTKEQSDDTFDNLFKQLDVAKKAYEEFQNNANENTLAAIRTVAGPLTQQAEKLKKDANDALIITRDEGDKEIKRLTELITLINKLQGAKNAQGFVSVEGTITAEQTKQRIQQNTELLTDQLREAQEELKLVNTQMDEIGETARASGEKFAETIAESNFNALSEQRNLINDNIAYITGRLADLGEITGAATGEALAKLLARLQKNLETAQDRQFAGIANATQALAAAQQEAALLEEKKGGEAVKLTQQEALQLAEARKRISAEELRIQQQISLEQGKGFKQVEKITGLLEKRKTATARVVSQTSIQAELGGISDERIAFDKEIAIAQQQLESLRGQVSKIAAVSPQAAAGLSAYITEQQKVITARQIEIELRLKEAQTMAYLRPQIEAVGQAALNLGNTFVDSLLSSFEGGKPDIIRGLKGVTDGLFKDSLKPAFESFKQLAQKGFTKALEKLDISGDMQKILGPSFVAGFGLIASFVLGQLLQGGKSSATAGNPNVGIQSSEQIRGLIGGETQIPIGLIGESLQTALVPTNLLLARIARGVESISLTSGLSPSQIESIVSDAVSESLQISTYSV